MALKIKKNPDGSIELEGSAEEITEYEKLQRGDVKEDKTSKKKILLNEELFEQLQEIIKEEISKIKQNEIVYYPWYESINVEPTNPYRYTPSITWCKDESTEHTKVI